MDDILVPLDFSECSINASKVALKLAKKWESEVTFTHLIPMEDDIEEKLANAKEEFQRDILKKVQKNNALLDQQVDIFTKENIKATKIIQYDSSYENLIDYVKKNNINLIIMGSQGICGVKELISTTNAQMIVRKSPIPVLVVKNTPPESEFKYITFASDFRHYPSQGFREIIRLAQRWKIKIRLLHICTPDKFEKSRDVLARMKEYSKGIKEMIVSTHVFNAYSIEEGIMEFQNVAPFDIVAFVTRARSGLSRVFHHSLTEKVVNHVDIPVLATHE
ncbi:MAG: universal stress protein [Cyclobacteriaceae bacterium]|nr:universal stress protein [Cyclobacteriaceae bacterium]